MSEANKERDPYFDNLKGILICLVCIGHCLNIYRGENVICEYLFDTIYAFHMPLFFYISGYFSKNVEKSYKNAFASLILPAIPFELLYYILHVITGAENTEAFLTPIFAYWFMFALFGCKVLLHYLSGIRFIIPITLILSLVAGFNPAINEYMTLSRFMCMLPFFMLGYFTDTERMNRILQLKPIIPIISGAVSLVIIWLMVKYSIAAGVDLGFTLRSSYEDYRGLIFRTLQYVLAVLLSLTIMKITPSKKSYLQTLGQRTLQIYFLHFYFVTIIKMANIVTGTEIIDALIMIAAGIVIALTLSTKPVATCYNKLIKLLQSAIVI